MCFVFITLFVALLSQKYVQPATIVDLLSYLLDTKLYFISRLCIVPTTVVLTCGHLSVIAHWHTLRSIGLLVCRSVPNMVGAQTY